MRWTRGFWRFNSKYQYRSLKDFLSDAMHGIYFYTSPFSLILTLTIFLSLIIFKINIILVSPLIAIFLFTIYLLIKSRLFFKESLNEILLIPLFLVFGNILTLIALKSWYDEKTHKEMKWFKAERSGLIPK